MQATIFISALASLIGFAVATPPACVINAIGVQGSDATDFKMLCDTKQEYVLGNLTESCSTSMLSDAYDFYSSKCKEEAQITVSELPSESSSSESSSQSGDSSSSSNSGNESSPNTENDGNGQAAASEEDKDNKNAATSARPAAGGSTMMMAILIPASAAFAATFFAGVF